MLVDNVREGVAPPLLEPAKPLDEATETDVTVPPGFVEAIVWFGQVPEMDIFDPATKAGVAVPLPPLATGKVPVTPVVKGKPVALVNVPLEGVPSTPPLTTGAPAEPTFTANAGGAGGNGSGGGGGGGGGGGWVGFNNGGALGGGVGILGQGSNGAGGAGGYTGANPGSGGYGSATNPYDAYGNGAGSSTATPAGNGAVRIIWGNGRAFPSTNTQDV